MNIKSIRSISLAVAMLIDSSAILCATQPQREDAAISAKLITAIENSDYEAFVLDGDSSFKQLKKAQFEAVAAQLVPRFKGGYEVSYLGELKQKSYHVTLWRISFKDGSDDALATLSIKAGKVGGFWIR